MNSDQDDVIRLPLWRECVKDMLKIGIEHGKIFESEYFEKWLRCSRDDMQFGLQISEVRRALEEEGYYLSGRGQHGKQYIIVPPEINADVMRSYGRKAADALRRGVILGTNTRLDLLAPEDRRRHESILEKMAIKSALIERSSAIIKALPEAARKTLVG